jgi:hypothetical protein
MPKTEHELPLMTEVDDATYDELLELVEQRVVHIALWEDSLADALEEGQATAGPPSTFDLDLYLEDGIYFELYGVSCFDDLDADPWHGLAESQARLAGLVARQARLDEIAVDEENGLVLVVGVPSGKLLYLAVAAWLLGEWDELPDG